MREAAAGEVARFDREYYRRFYRDPRSRVATPAEIRRRARLIAACVEYLGLDVRRILDAGCGIGVLRKPLVAALPRARYTGLEVSPYLCRRYRWIEGSVDRFRSAEPFDLVICYDVLPYLDAPRAARALANLGRLCRALLYFGALTSEDWRAVCDRSRTDTGMHLRPASWYRSRLRRHFVELGAGFWLRRGCGVPLWSLERAP